MFEVGRLCVKTAGREAGSKCVVVEAVDDNFVIIDGNVRRKRCSVAHLEPLKETIDIKNNAIHEEVIEAFKKLKIYSAKRKVQRKDKSGKPAAKAKIASEKKEIKAKSKRQ